MILNELVVADTMWLWMFYNVLISMITYPSTIANLNSFALFTHRNPDGDAIWSMLALGTWLENQGKIVDYFISTPISKTFDFLEKTKIIQSCFEYKNYDQIIFTDSANPVVMFQQFWIDHESYFEQANTLCIDHHLSNTGYAKENIINTKVSSTCELLTTLLEQWKPNTITPEIANYLYLWLSTDTGHFMYATTTETYKIAAKLIEYGADNNFITKNIYKSNTLEITAFTSKIMARAKASWKILWTWLDFNEITIAWIDREEAKQVLYQLQWIKRDGIIGYFEINESEGYIRCSLRTNNPQIDVSAVCSKLDPCGGGHKAAAGCKLVLTWKWKKKPLDELEDYIERINTFDISSIS